MSHTTTTTLSNDVTHETLSKTTLGFWVYLMTDCVLFASFFATYAVLQGNTFGGPSGKEIFSMPFVLVETMILLVSSFTCGLALLAAYRKNTRLVVTLLTITFLLGLSFLGMELYEFNKLIHEGFSWKRSAFLTSFFALVGTHGAHITAGLVWMAIMIYKLPKLGITSSMMRKLIMLSIFWHFLDLIWIFIFTVVYLGGVI